MTPAALLLAQAHEVPPAHLLIVGAIAVAGAVAWLLYRAARRRGDDSPVTIAERSNRRDTSGTAPQDNDRG